MSPKKIPSLKINQETSWVFNRPYLMGIVNVTPDSFYDGGFFNGLSSENFLKKIKKFEAAGVDLIDIGGESSRPGATPVSEEEELKRVIPKIRKIRSKFPDLILSLDTYKAKVAEQGILAGANIINDISSGEESSGEIFEICKKYAAPIILMHKKGVPADMQKNVHYKDATKEIYNYFKKKLNLLKKMGIANNKIMIDVGFGFGKHKKENLELLKNLKQFKKLKVGILVGASRKTTVGELIDKEADERLYGSIGISLAALKKGADMIRMHDPVEMKDALVTFFSVEEF